MQKIHTEDSQLCALEMKGMAVCILFVAHTDVQKDKRTQRNNAHQSQMIIIPERRRGEREK